MHLKILRLLVSSFGDFRSGWTTDSKTGGIAYEEKKKENQKYLL